MAEGRLDLTGIGDVRIVERLDEGASAVIYLGLWRGERVTLKLYKPDAAERHARLHEQELVEFKYRRNLALHEAPGLAPYVARPLAYLWSGGVSALVQERVVGRALDVAAPANGIAEALERLVERAHTAGFAGLALTRRHIVVSSDGERRLPRLVDFDPPERTAWPWRRGTAAARARDRSDLRRLQATLDPAGGGA